MITVHRVLGGPEMLVVTPQHVVLERRQHSLTQIIRLERFAQIVESTTFQGFYSRFHCRETRNQHNLRVGAAILGKFQNLDPSTRGMRRSVATTTTLSLSR